MRYLLLLLLTACATHNANLDDWIGAAEERAEESQRGTTQRVVDSAIYTSHQRWEMSLWYRVEDGLDIYPVRILIAESGDACLVSGADWAGTLYNSYYRCERWRRPRRYFE